MLILLDYVGQQYIGKGFTDPRDKFVQQHQLRFISTRGMTEIATKNVKRIPHTVPDPPVCSVTSGYLPAMG